MRKLTVGFALAISIAVAATAFAEPVHREIPFKKTVGLYTPRTYTFHFSIYDAASFGSELWFEEKPLRLKTKTLSYALGSGKTFEAGIFGPLDFSEQYWIQVSYWTGEVWKVIGVRDKLAAAPYALWGAESASSGPNTIANYMLIDGAVTDKKIFGPIGADKIDSAIARDDEVLGLLSQHDGPGSGLDADTLDGQHGDFYTSLDTTVVNISRQLNTLRMTAGKWSAPVAISAPLDSTFLNIVSSAPNKHMALWVASGIVCSTYSTGVGWSAPEKIVDSTHSLNYLEVSSNGSGDVAAVWQLSGTVYATTYSIASGWTPVTSHATGAVEPHPQVAVDAGGNAIAVWSGGTTRQDIYAKLFIKGTGWGPTQLIEWDETANANSPQIVFNSLGKALVTWRRSGDQLYCAHYSPITGWGDPYLVSDTANIIEPLELAIDTQDTILALYQVNSSLLWSRRYREGYGWDSATPIAANLTGTASVAMNPHGDAIAIWPAGSEVWAARYLSVSSWQEPERIDGVSGTASSPAVAMDQFGNATAVWAQSDDTVYNIWARRFSVANRWETPELLEYSSWNAVAPLVSINEEGIIATVWRQNTGTNGVYQVWSSLLN